MKNTSKFIVLLLIILNLIFICGCKEENNLELNEENCREYCPKCKEINKENCKDYIPKCEEINEDTCKDYIPKCDEINNETCKDYCPKCEEINEETCKEYTKKRKVFLGIDLIDENLSVFENKRVGLITNPTGINSDYKSTIDVLFEKINLVSLFAPEHGIRGAKEAGEATSDSIDSVTGLKIYSLYGQTKEPTMEMMNDIDILSIDIQDVGSRFYTYVYTMAYAMMACAKYGKTFVVFDRPNPLSNIVDGNILNKAYSSFVGMYETITRHGMTIGELATLFNEHFGINCDLKVIKMKNYDPTLYIDEITAPWVNPSPNMPTLDTAIVYGGTCLFEGVNLSEGRGTTKPFEFIGAPFIDSIRWANKLNSLNLEGVYFRPISFTPSFDDYQGKLCGGVQIHVTNREKFSSCKAGVAMLYTIKELYPNEVKFQSYLKTLSGVDYIYNMTYSLDKIFEIIDEDVLKFTEISKPYRLY